MIASKLERSIAMFFTLNGFGDLLIFVFVVVVVLIIAKEDNNTKGGGDNWDQWHTPK